MYDANIFLCRWIINFDFKIKFKEILKYKFVIMCMFNTTNYSLYVDWILVYNTSNNDT
jgi:hypothetical protein